MHERLRADNPDGAVGELEIVHEDHHLVAINKPAGLLVHRSAIDPHETRFALQLLRDQLGRRLYPVHRLDKPTSGVLVLALSPAIARTLGQAFTAGRVAKTYLAVVRGWTPREGVIDHPVREAADPYVSRRQRTPPPAQPATTNYRRLATAELPVRVDRYPTSRYALVQLAPRTGRRHQLRRHMKHIAHPIIGDTSHGKGAHNRLFQARFDAHRLLLAATRIRFMHPATGTECTIVARLDTSMSDVVRALGWEGAAAPYLAGS
jgi:tRNA pseudouridine65 synthase